MLFCKQTARNVRDVKKNGKKESLAQKICAEPNLECTMESPSKNM